MINLLQQVYTVVQILTWCYVQSLCKKKFGRKRNLYFNLTEKRHQQLHKKPFNLVTYRNNSKIPHCGKHSILLLGNLCNKIQGWGTKRKDRMTGSTNQPEISPKLTRSPVCEAGGTGSCNWFIHSSFLKTSPALWKALENSETQFAMDWVPDDNNESHSSVLIP